MPAWTTTTVPTTNCDAATDDPRLFRTDVKLAIDTLNIVTAARGILGGIAPLEDKGDGSPGLPTNFLPLNVAWTFNEAPTFTKGVVIGPGYTAKWTNSLGVKQSLWGNANEFSVGLQGASPTAATQQYFRSAYGFSFFSGGSHVDAPANPGSGGLNLFDLTPEGAVFEGVVSALGFGQIKQLSSYISESYTVNVGVALSQNSSGTASVVQEAYCASATALSQTARRGKARGSLQSPTNTQANDQIWGETYQVYGDGGWRDAAAILIESAGNASASSSQGRIRFAVTKANTTTLSSPASVESFGISAAQLQSRSQTLTDVAQTTANIAWNCELGAVAVLNMTGAKARTFGAPVGVIDGVDYTLLLKQDANGNEAIGSWSSVFKFAGGIAPTLSTGANKTDVFRFIAQGGNLHEISRTMNT